MAVHYGTLWRLNDADLEDQEDDEEQSNDDAAEGQQRDKSM